ncbi:MAG: hypothetical protein JST64_14590, partial [Actinobacteria bacterium]|nr:hypothetical protein [Actinomycetota bacterium]
VLGETAKAQIDAAHVAVVRAGRGDADAAVAAEVEVLSRYGFDSYLDYTIATSTRSVGQAVEAKLAELDDHVDHLDRALDDARAAAAEHLERLAAEREPAQQKVTDLLGYRPSGSSLEHLARLPEVPVAVTRLTLTLDEAAEQAQLELVRSRDAVAALEAERDDIESRRRELESRRAELDTRIVELDDVLERASAKLAVLEDRRRRATLDAETAEAEVESAAAALDHLLRTDRSSYSTGDVPAAIDALLARVEPPSGRVLPVVLVDVFEPFEADAAVAALDALAIRSEHCQLIYVTNDARICDWARTLDPARGRFESVAQGRWSPRRLGRRMLGRRNRSDHGITR